MATFNRKNAVLVILGSTTIIVCAFLISALKNPLRGIFRSPLSALTAIKDEAGGLIFYHRNMVRNRVVSAESDLLKRKLADAEETRLENVRLREMLGLKQNSPYKVIAAKVIGRGPSSWSSSIIIDKGSANGIRKGYVCVGFLGLIGRIVELTPTTGTVMMINDPNLCVSAIIQRSRQEGLICGSLSGILLMKYLTKESDIQVSDTIMTSGLTEVFPKGIVIGTVAAVRDEMSGLNRYAVVRPAVDFSGVEEVLVIIP